MPIRTAANPRKANPLPYQEGYQRSRGIIPAWRGESNIRDSAYEEKVFLTEKAAQRELLRKQNIAQGGVDIPDSPKGSVFKGIDGTSTRFNRERSSASTGGSLSFAEQDAAARRRSALSGAFGSTAKAKAEADVAREENVKARQGLFAEMKAFAAKGDKATPEDFKARLGDRDRAKALGISDTDFERGLAKASGREFTEPVAPQAAPLTGRALAERNIRAKGHAGAVADYFKRSEADKVALQQRQKKAESRNFDDRSAAATFGTDETPPPSKSFASAFATEVDKDDEPSPRLIEARKNAVAARTKADTMRAEYERSQKLGRI